MPDSGLDAHGSLERILDTLPAAFAVTRGPQHLLAYASPAFRALIAVTASPTIGHALGDIMATRDTLGLPALLDRVYLSGVVARNCRIGGGRDGGALLRCTIWPVLSHDGKPDHLLIELRSATPGELLQTLQREVAERLLLTALREKDAAESAQASGRRAAFITAENNRLTESLDEDATLDAMTKMSLPYVGTWCIVDMLDGDNQVHRLAILHPDPVKQAVLDKLDGRWIPRIDDGFGLPAVQRSAIAVVIADDVDSMLARSELGPGVFDALREIGLGSLLTVPLLLQERVIGAVTFVGQRGAPPFSREDIEMAEDLARRSAVALDRARLYGEAVSLRLRADSANEAKSAFLGMMSHELRTPLNAIGGYVDLLDLEIHGPVTDAQRVDLARIRSNQQYLKGLITDLLNFTSVDGGQQLYESVDVSADDVLNACVALTEPLFFQRQLTFTSFECDATLVARGDREKVIQILVNLLSNAIKFTPEGGRIVLECDPQPSSIRLHVGDTGIGIPPDKLGVIFDPFVQVAVGSTGREAGIGLGLAISRTLAEAMHGDLTVVSTVGEGSRFTLTLPRAVAGSPQERDAR